MKTAIILAAGIGSRLAPLTDDLPKCCIRVGHNSLIRRIVLQLLKVHSEMTIYIATGHCAKLLEREVADIEGDLKFIHNEHYLTTNNMESCRRVLEARTETHGSLILNADCIYDDEIVEKMLKSDDDCIAADFKTYNEENMKIIDNNGVIKNISKEIAYNEGVATSVDIYSFSEMTLSKLAKVMNEFYSRQQLQQWTEVAIDKILASVKVKSVDISGMRWVEIDNHEDLALARDLFQND